MQRAIVLLLFIPVLAGAVFGDLFFIAAPIMLGIAALGGLPLLYLLVRIRRLEWWHACLAGVLCAAAFTSLYWWTSPAGYIAMVGPMTALLFLGLGAILALVYWIAAIYRNERFPFVSRRFPRAMLLMIPIIGAGAWMFGRVSPRLVEGRVVAVLAQDGSTPARPQRARVRLRGGTLVEAPVSFDPEGMPFFGECVTVNERWSISQLFKVHNVTAFKLGERYNDC